MAPWPLGVSVICSRSFFTLNVLNEGLAVVGAIAEGAAGDMKA